MTSKIIFGMIHATTIKQRRSLYISQIAPLWDAQGVEYQLFLDPPGPQKDLLGIWANARRAWLTLADSDATHVCVLNDDHVPCPDFLAKLEAFLDEHTGDAVCFFQPAAADASAIKALMTAGMESFSLPESMIMWGGTIVLPRVAVAEVIGVADRCPFDYHDDIRITHACDVVGLPMTVRGTSLVAHLGARFESYTGPLSDNADVVEYRTGYTFDVSDFPCKNELIEPQSEGSTNDND